MAWNRVFYEHGLQNIGNLVGHAAIQRQLTVEDRHMLLDAFAQIGIGEPHEILKACRHEFVEIGHVEFQLGSGGRVGVRVFNIGEGAGSAQVARGSLEVLLDDGCSELQAGRGRDVGLGKSLAAGYGDGNQLSRRRGHLVERLLLGQPRRAEREPYHQDGQQSGREPRHRVGVCTNSCVDLCFTAMSMNASAARLSALSLRNTRAKSRRTCTSAIGTADSTRARTSSSTFERAMNPTPTSAATNRFSNSLESSSIVKFGLSRRSWNSCSMASRVWPAFGTTSGNLEMSAMVADFSLPRAWCGGAITINSSR